MKNLSYPKIREQMCEVARQIWGRRLTTSYGGSFAARAGEFSFLVTPSLLAEEKHFQLFHENLFHVSLDGKVLEGTGRLSRETDILANILRSFPTVGAVILAHPLNCMVFAAAGKAIPSVTEATARQGSAGLSKPAEKGTPEMTANILAHFSARRLLLEDGLPLGCVVPKYGVVVTGKDIYKAFTMLELTETDAYCALNLPKLNG